MIIYFVVNKITKKWYIGKSVDPWSYRWSRHLSRVKHGSKTYFHNAVRHYGADNFVLIGYDKSAQDLLALAILEKKYIAIFRSNEVRYGYNLTAGGDGGRQSPESIERARQTRIKNGGWHHTEEFKLKMSERMKGNKHHNFGRKGPLSPLYGKMTAGKEQMEKLRLAKIGVPRSEETKKKMSENRKGKLTGSSHHFFGLKGTEHPCSGPKSAEHLRKMAEGRKKFFEQRKAATLVN